MLIYYKNELLILNSCLERLEAIDFREGPLMKYANKMIGVEWIDNELIVVFDSQTGSWSEYDVARRQICREGAVLMKRKFFVTDWQEHIVHAVGRSKFFISGSDKYCRNLEHRICFSQDGKSDRNLRKISSPTGVYYYAPGVVVIER